MTKTLADIAALLKGLLGPERAARAQWAAREPTLTKPAGSLGRLEEITQWLSMWQGRHPPLLENVVARVFVGNHGVAAQGVSAFPAAVTHQMVLNFERGGAAINQLCRINGIELEVIPLNDLKPTQDFSQGPAMTEAEFARAFDVGFNSVPTDADLLVIGEMGIGNTTAAAALSYGLWGGHAPQWTGRGTGVEGDSLIRKTHVVEASVKRHVNLSPLELMQALGGFELAAMAGAVIAARHYRIPVLLDGYVAGAAVAPLEFAVKGALDHCMAAHVSAEPGHRKLLENLNKKPLLDLDMRLGEASGAALAVGLVRSALACHTGMATFTNAGVSNKE